MEMQFSWLEYSTDNRKVSGSNPLISTIIPIERNFKMKLTNISQVEDFIAAVNRAHSNVWLVSPQGDRYNMKSALSQYIALGALLGQHGDELELFCDDKQDEGLFIEFFIRHPEV